MGIRDVIARARRAQAEHDRRIPVQLEMRTKSGRILTDEDIEEFAAEAEQGYPVTLWASEEEQLQRFRHETFTETELQLLREDMAKHPQDY
jgi:hypothetical protein